MTDKHLSILIVEDSESDAELVIRQFKKADYDIIFKRVETAYQMETALEDASWDLVISDYNLPEFDASSALTVLQKSGQDIPFIVVSGVVGEETAVALMKAGASDYVMKGNLTRLVPAVDRELGEAQTRRAKQRAEEALFESEERRRTAMECSNDGIAISKGGLHVYVNPKFLEMFGFEKPEEVLGKPASIIAHPKTGAY